MNKKDFIFIGKTLFFPEKEILVIGDLHLGYEVMLRQEGIMIFDNLLKETIEELKKVFNEIDQKGWKLKKIVFLGDIKHYFSYEGEEKVNILKLFDFIKEKVNEKDIIILKGNHDTIDFFSKMKDYFADDDIAFIHGDRDFIQTYDSKIKTIVMGHIHPSVLLSDPKGVKKEDYKCFLLGNYKGKEIIIVPSFLHLIQGGLVNNYDYEYEDNFSIIPKKDLLKFKVYIVGEDKVYEFGKIKDLIS